MIPSRDRKALSPLIATALLIAFAVSLGVIIINIGIDTPDEHEGPQTSACERTEIGLQQLTDGDAICYDAQGQRVRFLLKNTGDQTIDKIMLRAIDSNQDVGEQEANAQLPPGGLGKFEIAYETSSPNNLVASITPIVTDAGAQKACPDKEIQEVTLPLC